SGNPRRSCSSGSEFRPLAGCCGDGARRPKHKSRYLHRIGAVDTMALFRCEILMHNAAMIYSYACVSTAAQDDSGQVAQLKAAGCEKVFREKITGTPADRTQLQKLMKALGPGAVVITRRLTASP